MVDNDYFSPGQMNAITIEIFSLSILIAAIVAVFRSAKSDRIYYPFFVLARLAISGFIIHLSS
jgi:hypothetical protein